MILRPRRLADALATNTLSEAQKFQYLLLWTLSGVLLQQHGGTWEGWTRPRMAFVALSILITVLGLTWCFQTNARGDNRAFLERYVCLSALVGLIASAIYVATYYALGILALAGGWIDLEARGWNRDLMALVASVLALSTYYLWMRQLLHRVARVRTA
jgi:hypothetical protein